MAVRVVFISAGTSGDRDAFRMRVVFVYPEPDDEEVDEHPTIHTKRMINARGRTA
jgi:hypothetical protein